MWLLVAFIIMALYEAAWIRFFKTNDLGAMYSPLGPIPVPLASLPVVGIFVLGVWYMSPVAIAASIVLGIGHIGIHLSHLRELSGQ